MFWNLDHLIFRQNAIRLELKDKTEKELLSQIIDEANEYKDEFYKKRLVGLETNKGIFREKEKVRSILLLHAFMQFCYQLARLLCGVFFFL